MLLILAGDNEATYLKKRIVPLISNHPSWVKGWMLHLRWLVISSQPPNFAESRLRVKGKVSTLSMMEDLILKDQPHSTVPCIQRNFYGLSRVVMMISRKPSDVLTIFPPPHKASYSRDPVTSKVLTKGQMKIPIATSRVELNTKIGNVLHRTIERNMVIDL